MGTRPIIGLTAAVDGEQLTSLPRPYAYAIERAGALPLVLPYTESEEMLDAFLDVCDGIFLTGGKDIDPRLYNEAPRPTCGDLQPERDSVELAVLRKAVASDKPILAICRGSQLVNVFFGGTLYQDIPTEYEAPLLHRQAGDIYAPSHRILIREGTPLHTLIGERQMVGNSFHHQAVKTLGEGLLVTATAEDGMIEGFYAPALRYLRAYQWHPERLYDTDEANRRIFADFLAAATEAV